ncbi:hypothetical protein HNY73_005983 [Argiope bruennichi]|uniref:Transposase n=1 Tax=Argiope bruennichi TaxID=94029 RepID=A0A8T0FIG6_ARGBR|nr:hypothetical protein HNY73_005983 [Argiope bruennichi]
MLLTRGSNTTNYVESFFKVLKETILGRIEAFSLVKLLDYIVTKVEVFTCLVEESIKWKFENSYIHL